MVDFYKLATGKTFEELVRPEIRALRARGQVTWVEWDQRMNSYEREHLLPGLDDAAFLRAMVYCATQVGFGTAQPGTYDWAMSREYAPEAVKRGFGVDRNERSGKVRGTETDFEARAEFFAETLRLMVRGLGPGEWQDAGGLEWQQVPDQARQQWVRLARAVVSFTDRMARGEHGYRPPERERGGWFMGMTEISEKGVIRHIDAVSAYPELGAYNEKDAEVTAKLLAETLPALANGQEHCPECGGEGGFDPDEIPAAPVVCPTCEGTGVVAHEKAEWWRARNRKGFEKALSSLCPGCGSLNGLLEDGTCRECPWTRARGE